MKQAKKEFREMVAYLIDTDDSSTIDSYTETFVDIAERLVSRNVKLKIPVVGVPKAEQLPIKPIECECKTAKDRLNCGYECYSI